MFNNPVLQAFCTKFEGMVFDDGDECDVVKDTTMPDADHQDALMEIDKLLPLIERYFGKVSCMFIFWSSFSIHGIFFKGTSNSEARKNRCCWI